MFLTRIESASVDLLVDEGEVERLAEIGLLGRQDHRARDVFVRNQADRGVNRFRREVPVATRRAFVDSQIRDCPGALACLARSVERRLASIVAHLP